MHVLALGFDIAAPSAERIIRYNFKRTTPLPVIRIIL